MAWTPGDLHRSCGRFWKAENATRRIKDHEPGCWIAVDAKIGGIEIGYRLGKMRFYLRERADCESRMRYDRSRGGRNSILQIVLPGRAWRGGIKSILRKSKVEDAVGSAPGNLDRTERRLHESEKIAVIGFRQGRG